MDKRKILFVDEDPLLLNGLKRMLSCYNNEWQMHFATGAIPALKMLREKSIDLIVTDIKLTDIDGLTFLRTVKEHYPSIIRIILSGHLDKEEMIQISTLTHQILSKPSPSELLKETIDKTFYLNMLITSEQTKQAISQITSLPSLPHVYNQLMKIVQNDDFSMKDVAEIIAQDVGMSANIIKQVNTAFWEIPNRISTPERAVMLLGFEIIKALVLSTHLFHSIDPTQVNIISIDSLMNHSSSVGNIAKKIVLLESNDRKLAEQALIAGLLHDIGKLILLSNFSEEYPIALQMAEQEQLPLWSAERTILQVTHAEVGAYLLGLWGMPYNIVEAVAYHHHKKIVGELSPLIIPLAAANRIATIAERERETITTLPIPSIIKNSNHSQQYQKWVETILNIEGVTYE